MADVVNDWNRLEKQIRLVESNDSSCLVLKCRFEAPSNSVAVPLWDGFCKALMVNTRLHSLDLSRNPTFGDKGAQSLAAALPFNTSLTRLNLRACHIGRQGAAALAESLRENRSLVDLDLSDNVDIGPEAASILEAVKDHKSLMILKLCACDLRPNEETLNALRRLVKYNPVLRTLDIHHNYFPHEALRKFFIAIRESSVTKMTELDLDSMGVGIVAMKELIETLNVKTQLSSLSLRKNAIGGAPIASLLKGIRTNGSLTQLNLARSRLKDIDLKAMGDFLRDPHACLKELDISDNGLSKHAMEIIVENWGGNKSLTSLSLGRNNFSSSDLSHFISYVSASNSWRVEFPAPGGVSSTISSLDFSELKAFGPTQAKELAALIRTDSTPFDRIILHGTSIDSASGRVFLEACKKSSTLSFLDLRKTTLANEEMYDFALHYSTSPTLSRVLMDYTDPKKLLYCKILARLNLSEVPQPILKATHLAKLNLKSNRLTSLPPDIANLTDLVSLSLQNNLLETLPSELGFVTSLKKLKLDGNPLRTPPVELRQSAAGKAGKILGYLRDLHHGLEYVYRVKLMFVGQENVGKTTLLSLLKKKYKSKTYKSSKSFSRQGSAASMMRTKSGRLEQFLSTDGIDINEIQMEVPMPKLHAPQPPTFASRSRSLVGGSTPGSRSSSITLSSSSKGGGVHHHHHHHHPPAPSHSNLHIAPTTALNATAGASCPSGSSPQLEKRTITLSTWDFGGQDIYYSTHQFFLSDHSIFLILWDMRYEEEKSKVGFWLQSIQARTNNALAIIVGTHADDPSCGGGVAAKKIEQVKYKYRKIKMVKGCIGLSCLNGDLTELIATLTSVIQEMPIMGNAVPSSYMALSHFIRQYREATDAEREAMLRFSEGQSSPLSSSSSIQPLLTSATQSMLLQSQGSSSSLSSVGSGVVPPINPPPVSPMASRSFGPRRASSANTLFVGSLGSSTGSASSTTTTTGGGQSSPTPSPRSLEPISIPYKSWSEFSKLAKLCHIDDGEDLKRCAETLHLMGDIVYFDDPKLGLSDLVILDSQFLTHVMATIITTKQNYVKNGVINYNDLRHIWKLPLFPTEIHPYLLAILEKFEIVFTANEQLTKRLVEYFDISPAIKSPAYPMSGLGVIPSLLPEAVPVLDLLWTKFDEKILQYDRQYVFDLVPAGLFSRLIVRCLHTATEVLHCWRYGTVFLCADSMCLVELNNRKSSISVTMRGGKNPAEQLRNIMEVIEALILRDNWWRTSVTRQISCLSCLQHLTNNHHYSSTTPRSDGNETAEDKTGSSDSIRTSQSNKNFNVIDYIPDAPKRSRSNSSSTDLSGSSRKGSSHGFRHGADSASRTERKGSSKSAKASSTRAEGSPSTTKRPTVTVLSSPPTSPRGIVGSPAGSSPPVTRVFDVVAIPQFDSVQGKRPPSLGQLKHARDATAITPTSSSSTIPSNLSTSSFNRDGSNGSVGATSSVGSPATSSENLVGGSAANMEVEPCYIPLEDCERAAAEGNAFVTCEQGHMNRLDRLAPDVALADFEGIRIPFNDISLEYPSFARGSFGELFKGTWKGQEVAVKQLVCDPLEAQRIYHEFRREVWIMSSLNHPNLVNLKGFCLEPSPSMVMEYIAGGNLYSFLHANDSDVAGPSPLEASLILKIALDVANGINFLHSATPPYIHRDLKSPNILLTNTDPTADVVAKVADFGLTNRMVIPLRKEGRSQRAVVNPTWQAPEIMREEEFSEKSDTYAYGIILWELYTRRHPFGDIKSNFLHDVEDAVVRDKKRPPIPDSCPREFAKLMQECWAEEPNNRPDFKRIIEDLHFMIEKMGFSNLIRGSLTKPPKPRTHKPSRKQSSEKVPPSASGHHHHHHHKERRAAKSSVGASNSLGPTPSSKAQTTMLATSSSIAEAEGSKLLSSDVYGESEILQPPTVASVKKMKRRSAPIQRPRSSERRSPTRMGTLESMDSSGSIDSTIELRRASFSSSRSNDSSTVAFENPIHSEYFGSLTGQTSYSMMSRNSGSISGGATRSSNSSGNTTTTTITSSVTSSEAPSSSKSTSGHAESVDDSNPQFSILPMRSDPSSLVPSCLPTIPEKESINPRTSSSMLSTLSQEEEDDSDLDFMDSNMRDNQGGHSSSSDDSGVSRPDSSSSSDMDGEEPSPRHGGRPSVSQQPSSLLQQDDGPFDNPVFAGGANASSNLAGRFTKQLRVMPPTRITALFPVGTSQIWGTGRDGSVHIWNAKNGELLSAHEKAHDGCIKAAVPVLDTVWMSCPKQQAIGVWHVRRADMGSRVEKRSGTLQVGQWSVSSQKVSHWKMRFVVINFKDGSLKVFPMPKEPTSSKNAGSFSEFSTPTTAPMKEISLINTPTNPVTFGLAIEHSPSTFKVSCQSITLYFELEEEHDMLEWLECIASIATGDRLICLTTLSNEWTKNITVMHVPSVKGELLITGSSDSDMSVVSWNVHTKSVVCSVKLSAHFDRDMPMPEGKDAKITSIVTSTKHRYTLAAVGSIVFVLNNKTLDVVQTLRKTPSPIVSMAIARPKEIWTTCKDGSIHVWNAQSLTYVASFPSPSASRIYCIVPVSSTRVWTAGKDGIIRIWNSADRTLEMTLPAHHRGSVQTLILWHHSMWSCGPDKTICIWT